MAEFWAVKTSRFVTFASRPPPRRAGCGAWPVGRGGAERRPPVVGRAAGLGQPVAMERRGPLLPGRLRGPCPGGRRTSFGLA